MKNQIILIATLIISLSVPLTRAQLIIPGAVPVTTPTPTNFVVTRFVISEQSIKTHVNPRHGTNEVMVIRGIANGGQAAAILLTNPADISLCAGILAQAGPNEDVIAALGTNTTSLTTLELTLARANIRLH